MKTKSFQSYLDNILDTALDGLSQAAIDSQKKNCKNLLLEFIKEEQFFEAMLQERDTLIGDFDGDQLPEIALRGFADTAGVPFNEVVEHTVIGNKITILTENDGVIQFIANK